MTETKEQVELSIIVPTKDRAKQLATLFQCIGSQKDIEKLNFEIVIVDNNSTDNTKEVAYAFCEGSNLKVNYVLEENIGSSAARNRGILTSKGSYLLFLDDDILIPNDFIANAFFGIKEFPEFHIYGFRVLPDWQGRKKPFWLSFNKPFNLIQSFLPVHDLGIDVLTYPNRITKNPISAGFIVKKEVFEKVGPFREDLGIGNGKTGLCEDTEFFWFSKINKFKLLYWPYAVLYHPVSRERLSVAYLHKWYFNLGKSLYLIKNTGRIFNIKKRPIVGTEGYIANKMPVVFKKILLEKKILNVTLFLWLKLLVLIMLLPFSVFLIFVKRPFYLTTKFAKTIGEVKQAMKLRILETIQLILLIVVSPLEIS